MKRFFLTPTLILALLLSTFASFAQKLSEVFNKSETPITWIGLDFSETKYIGDPGTVNPAEMKSLFTKINGLMVAEPEKYDIAKAFKRNAPVAAKIEVTEARNEKIDADKIISPNLSDQEHFTTDKIQDIVSKYKFPTGASGVGLVFVMESLVKTTEKESFWVTFIDTSTKKVLYTERLTVTAVGIGFRNHWAGGIYAGLKQIKFSEYGKWKKQFAK